MVTKFLNESAIRNKSKYNLGFAVQGSTFRVKTFNYFILIGFYPQHVHKAVNPMGESGQSNF